MDDHGVQVCVGWIGSMHVRTVGCQSEWRLWRSVAGVVMGLIRYVGNITGM